MNKVPVFIIAIISITFIGFFYLFLLDYNAVMNSELINVSKTLKGDSEYIHLKGNVNSFDKEVTKHWIMFIPIVISTGKSSTIILTPILMNDVDYVYELCDLTGCIPVKFDEKIVENKQYEVWGSLKDAENGDEKTFYVNVWKWET